MLKHDGHVIDPLPGLVSLSSSELDHFASIRRDGLSDLWMDKAAGFISHQPGDVHVRKETGSGSKPASQDRRV